MNEQQKGSGKKNSLSDVRRLSIPEEFVLSIYREFQDCGKEGYEYAALLAGIQENDFFQVTNLVFPEQQLRRSPAGLSFFVSEQELDWISDWLWEHKCHLIAQVHSHPSEAYHSETDDELAIVTAIGGFSIVVPYFGYGDRNFEGSAVFRLIERKGWVEMERNFIDETIQIEKNGDRKFF